MIDISTIEVSGIEGAIKGLRNPFKNREKSDSGWGNYDDGDNVFHYIIGEKDLDLCQKLLRSDKDDDSKFMRYIHVQADVNAPLYWWKEYDTYKISTVANSESTMHTIHKREFTINDFAHDMILDDYTIDEDWEFVDKTPELLLEDIITMLNSLRLLYLKAVEKKDAAKAKDYWYNIIQLLPSSYMQKRTIDLNYQTLRRIYFARKDHKLKEWRDFREWIMSLPYAEELITYKPPKVFNGLNLPAFYYKVKDLMHEGYTDEQIRDIFCMNTVHYREVKSAAFRFMRDILKYDDPEIVNFDVSMYAVKDETSPLYFVDKERGFDKSAEMQRIRNLITKMVIQGTTKQEIARAVKHSMVVIDAEKLHLDWKRSELDNDISGLMEKYCSKP